jgi:glycosyltransferase involved in cell wall biosynthesis
MSPGHDPSYLLQLELDAQRPAAARAVRLSLVLPVYNELENLRPLVDALHAVFDDPAAAGGDGSFEILLVDDGSTDGSRELIVELAAADPCVRPVLFSANRGQTAAIVAGFHMAHGELIAMLDADLQNDPVDLPRMIELLGDHDAVVGFRMKRNDTWIRRVSSRIANAIRNSISGDSIRDTGCSLKVFRADAIRSIPMFEGLHRFLPTLLRYHGYSVIEHGVSHHPRVAGISKYGVGNRAWRAFKDLLAVRWMRGRLIRFPLER